MQDMEARREIWQVCTQAARQWLASTPHCTATRQLFTIARCPSSCSTLSRWLNKDTVNVK